MRCPVCAGSGISVLTAGPCRLCGGTGTLPDDRLGNPRCNFCAGSGLSIVSPGQLCPVCGGWGRLPTEKEEEAEVSGPAVVRIEAGKPRTGHHELESVFAELKGHVRVCDPYYGPGTITRLELLVHCDSVWFLTSTLSGGPEIAVHQAIKELTREHPHMELRKYKGPELHDRYVLSDEHLILLGQGLKDTGARESFVVRLDKDTSADVMNDVRLAFDEKWKVAAPIV